MSRNFVRIALALPLLAIGFGIARSEWKLSIARDFTFEIGGYDPRDLLRGRYLQFQLRLQELATREACDSVSEQCCLCLTSTTRDQPVLAERSTCTTARAQCDGALSSEYVGKSLRYYVPELQASTLEEQMMNAMQHRAAHAVLSVGKNGRAEVRELRLYGNPIAGAVTPVR
jgi:uncharacterized membrane-anchored protein